MLQARFSGVIAMILKQKLNNNRAVILLKETLNSFGTDNGSLLASAVAYYLLFSLFPFALAVISIAGFAMESSTFETQVINAIGNLIPVARKMLTEILNGVVEARAATGIIAVLGLIWSASAFFDALRRSLNASWGLPNTASFIKGKLTAISMTVLSIILLIIYIWMSTLVRYIHTANWNSDIFQFINSTTLTRVVFAVLSGVLAFVTILLLYKFIPSKRPDWKDIWPGALMAAIGFEIVRFAFIWYLKNFGHYNLVYGSVGAVIVLLLFIYISAWVLLFFAKLSAVNLKLKSKRTL
jgi:membrane protein